MTWVTKLIPFGTEWSEVQILSPRPILGDNANITCWKTDTLNKISPNLRRVRAVMRAGVWHAQADLRAPASP
jgi:hypothetical protein